jgi:hypothetical protein
VTAIINDVAAVAACADTSPADRRQHIDAAVDEYLNPFKLIEACEISDDRYCPNIRSSW